MAELPPLPTIVGEDLLLDIYTHKSLIPSGAPMNEEYGDTDRLADLGARVLDLAVTFHFIQRDPCYQLSKSMYTLSLTLFPEQTCSCASILLLSNKELKLSQMKTLNTG
jgi:hypothetical protein